ncbi:hypothetical protein A1O3_08285, partial [Capronia epimyces CBS 606.96]
MAKSKSSKGDGPQIPNKHLHSRISFLHQAAAHLVIAGNSGSATSSSETSASRAFLSRSPNTQNASEASRLLNHSLGVSRKLRIRLASDMKHSICKRCDSLLLPGRTSTELVVNQSKNGRKPWADVFEIRCIKCGTIKRFPVGVARGEKGQEKPASLGAVEK